MSKGVKFKKFLLKLVTTVSVIITVVTVLWMLVFHLILVPKFGISRAIMPTGKDMLQITKFVINGNLVDNLKNFDRETAKDVLGVMIELEADINAENKDVDKQIEDFLASSSEKLDIKKIVPKSDVKQMIESAGLEVSKKEETAVDRIMAAATKEEINLGMAILSKIDLAKLKAMHEKGDRYVNDYLRKTLTKQEISSGVMLYRKYKHLL